MTYMNKNLHFCNLKKKHYQLTDGPTDGRTDALIEMRGRIYKPRKSVKVKKPEKQKSVTNAYRGNGDDSGKKKSSRTGSHKGSKSDEGETEV